MRRNGVHNVIMNSDFYSKEQACIVSGIALIMMLIHHFFGFSSYLVDENEYYPLFCISGISIERMLGSFGKLCVAVFAFNTGYVMWSRSVDYLSYTKIMHRLSKFLFCYWIICLLFIIYALIVSEKLPSSITFLYNLWGLKLGPEMPYVNVCFGWYVTFYLMIVLLSPLFLKIFQKQCFIIDCTLLLLLVVFFRFIANMTSVLTASICNMLALYGECTIIGLLVNKYELFVKLDWLLGKRSICIYLFVLIFIALCRQGLILANVDVIYTEGIFVFLFVYLICCIRCNLNSIIFERFCMFIGSYSMNLWFLHGIFFTAEKKLQWLLYYPRYSPLILIWGVLLLLPISMICSLLQEFSWRWIRKIKYLWKSNLILYK